MASYEDVCKHVGKIYLESQFEIERLTQIISQIQDKLKDNEDKDKRISQLEEIIGRKNGTSS